VQIGSSRQELLSKIFLFRDNFTTRNIGHILDFDDLPIIVVDDMFSEERRMYFTCNLAMKR